MLKSVVLVVVAILSCNKNVSSEKDDRPFAPLKIKFVYSDVMKQQANFNDLKKMVFKPVAERFSKLLQVYDPPETNLIVRRTCVDRYLYKNNGRDSCWNGCKDVSYCLREQAVIPELYLRKCSPYKKIEKKFTNDNPGEPNYNLIIIVTFEKEGCTSAAKATFCRQDERTRRPVMGNLNICKMQKLNYQVERFKAIIMHEIFHVLAVSNSLYLEFITPKNVLRIPKEHHENDKIIEEHLYRKVNSNGRKYNILKTETVVKVAREYFNCPTLEGAYMDIGNNHFLEEFLHTEIMTPVIEGYSVISKFTLAILHDSGWYKVNWNKADPIVYGKGLGCDFITKTSKQYIADRLKKDLDIFPYCQEKDLYNFRCSINRLYNLQCQKWNRYGSDPSFLYTVYEHNARSPYRFANCRDPSNNYYDSSKNKLLNLYTSYSNCYEDEAKKDVYCYESLWCFNGQIGVYFANNQAVYCNTSQVVALTDYGIVSKTGNLKCPEKKYIC